MLLFYTNFQILGSPLSSSSSSSSASSSSFSFYFYFYFFLSFGIHSYGKHLVSFLIPNPEWLGHWNFNATPPPCLLIKRTTAFI